MVRSLIVNLLCAVVGVSVVLGIYHVLGVNTEPLPWGIDTQYTWAVYIGAAFLGCCLYDVIKWVLGKGMPLAPEKRVDSQERRVDNP